MIHATHEKGQMSDPTLVSAALVLLGLGVCAAGLTAVLFGRTKPLPLRSRRQGLAALCAGALMMTVGTTITTAADPSASDTSATNLSRIGTGHPTTTSTPTSTSNLSTPGTDPSGTDPSGTDPPGTDPSGTDPSGTEQPTGLTATPDSTETAGATETTTTQAAVVAVERLLVKGRGPRTGYDRGLFGQAWFDADRNGCDTRNDVLRRDLAARTMKNECKVLAGMLVDPYTASRIWFVYGGVSEVDVDHVVAVSDAWQKGAAAWSAGKRLAFANDPLNLLAVDAHTNRSKGDGDTATWLPPNKAFRCEYVARQVAVKLKYEVSVTTAEKAAMHRVLAGCPILELPAPGPAPTLAALPASSAP